MQEEYQTKYENISKVTEIQKRWTCNKKNTSFSNTLFIYYTINKS